MISIWLFLTIWNLIVRIDNSQQIDEILFVHDHDLRLLARAQLQ